ncbi:tRNA (guanosine(37)-N1)-methyltransferase TrmD [Caproiciproducens sp. NJN-50]|uniref:tRNA (guanosine(37)-N1)-methyltransferase TrmD n=1 Tax=Acutalibacteraceae TaxID=3082771 RepID=UPI000FFE19F9|nr:MULTISPECIES: tRNA (guanosine(37)-N1)-methyltransferase TrmD [Acutalibacteraceae]QAT50156.1 tRNA (guanosine(37)-N1)-methyltransferase TrmD [Caproiciproducens sp. NJN-50]
MRIDLLTLFPEMCETVMAESIIGRARKKGAVQVCCHQIRDYALDKHSTVDDSPFGGGMGMLLKAEPIALCMDDLIAHLGKKPHTVYLSPQGKTLTQNRVRELSELDGLVLLCGHYEGVDERVLEAYADEEISAGDYVVTGGELPALLLADAVCRMVPGVLSDVECYTEESHFHSLLEYPQYTRPADWRGRRVPEVLLSGDHERVRRWRREQSLARTAVRRPELLSSADLTGEDREFLQSVSGSGAGETL